MIIINGERTIMSDKHDVKYSSMMCFFFPFSLFKHTVY